jgi:CheY-like chemotaxis protein
MDGQVRVLLVEDHPVNQKVVAKLLARLGCFVDLAPDGAVAVARVAAGFDLVLMDCSMTVMDGFEATRRIRAASNRTALTPVVALTAHATEADRDRCLAAGMDAWLPKPVSQEQLAGVLRTWTRWKPEPELAPMLDEDTVETLLSLGGEDDPQFFDGLVDELAAAVAQALIAARAELAEGRLGDLTRTLHRLAGGAATIGASQLHREARALERAEPGALLALAGPGLARIEAVAEASIRALRDRAAATRGSR